MVFGAVVLPRLEPLPPPGVFFPGMLLNLYGVIVAHEVGHLVAGLTQNFRFGSMIVGPLWIQRERGRLRVRLNRSLALAGGIVSMLPNGDEDLRRRNMVLLAGGPGASMVLGLGLLAAGLAFPPAPLLLLGSLCSMLIGLATMIPNEMGGFSSDGYRIAQLRKGGEEVERLCRMQGLHAASQAGLAIGEWPEATVRRLAADPGDRTESALGLSLVYLWQMERGEVAEAGETLDRMMAHRHIYPGIVAEHLSLEAAWFAAVQRRDLEEAREHLARAGEGKMQDKGQRARAEAAVLALEGRVEEARRRQAEALEHLEAAEADGGTGLVRRMIEESVPAPELSR